MAKKTGKKIYVIDTNVFLSDFNAIYAFKTNDIIVPLKVLEEIDKHKKRQDGVGANARQIIRIFDKLRESGNLHDGVKIGKGYGVLSVRTFGEEKLPHDMSMQDPDNQILATVQAVIKANVEKSIILVSQDINMRVKADSLGIESEDYTLNKIVQKVDEIYSGFINYTVDDNLIDLFYTGNKVFIREEEIQLFPNQFVMLVSNINEKKTALCKFKGYDKPLAKVREFKEGVWGIRAKSKEQQFALDLLMDPDIKLVTILGRSGGGKTLIALAAALEQVLETQTYKKIIVSRPVQPMGRDIGFLPGDLKEKLLPWLTPVQDNLEFLMGDSKEDLEFLMEQGTIELEALTYIRGRSIANAIMLIDEFQNLNLHELKTILTRVGENTKIILTGDINQLDNAFLDSTNNGLTHAVEKFKQYDISGHVTLQKGERSVLATLASEIL